MSRSPLAASTWSGGGGSHRRPRGLVVKAWRHLADERRAVLLLAVVAVVAAQAESAALVLIALIADAVARDGSSVHVGLGDIAADPSVAMACVLAVGSVLVAALLIFTSGRLVARARARLEREMRDRVVLSYARADWEFQSGQRGDRIQARLRMMDARARVFTGLIGWARGLATLIVFIVVAAVMSPVAAVLILASGSLLSLAVLPIRRWTIRLGRQMANADVTLTEEFSDALNQGADVHVFGAWSTFIRRFTARSQYLQAMRVRVAQLQQLLPVVYQYGAFLLIILVLIAASWSGSGGEIGRFAASALLLLRSVQYGQMLQLALHDMAASVPRLELMESELIVPSPKVTPGDRSLERIESIQLREVYYLYPGSAQFALNGVSLDLRPGSIVGLAGPSGSGKTTLAQILLRLRWPTSGQYLVNGRSSEEYSTESWNRIASHLPQQPHLLHGTLAENVTYFDPSIPSETVIAALAAVGLDGLLESLPDGLDTQLGPAVRNLSGGQVQRLGIARALVRTPRLVVLDEPTSALDVNSERIVGEALSALRGRDVLVVVIAHRPSTLALCDEIVVLQAGRVTAAGSMESLNSRNGFLEDVLSRNGSSARSRISSSSAADLDHVDSKVDLPRGLWQ